MAKKYIYQEGNLCGYNWLLTTLISISSSINQSSEAYNDIKYGCGYATDHISYQQNGALKTESNYDNSHYFILDKNNNSSLDFNGYKYIAIEYEIEGDDSQIANCEVTINGEYIINSNQNTNRTIAKIEIPQDREYSYDPTIIIGTENIKSENYETKKLKIYNIWLETESNNLYNLTSGFINKLINKIKQELSKKVDKEEGKVLSSNDFTNEDKSLLDDLRVKGINISDIKRLTIESGELQLTKDKYQIADVSSGTKILMPEIGISEWCVEINLIINAKEDMILEFDDIKWKEIPRIKNGFDYILSFTCTDNIWYGEIIEYRKFEKSYLYKNGDECSALSGGWDYIWVQNWSYGAGTLVNPSEYSKEEYGWAKCEEYIEYQGYNYGSNYGYMQYFQTANAIDFSNYTKMYVEYSIEKYTYEDGSEADYGGTPIHIKVGNTALMSKGTLTPKTVGKFDISSITDSQKVGFGMMVERGYETRTNKLKVYKIWLEGEETKTDQEIIYERITTLEDQTSTINTTLSNKVDKIDGKSLSTEDFTTFYKEKLDNLEAISAQIVDELPEIGDKNCYYFVPDNQSEGANNDFYVTFMYFETLGWKTIGTTKIDLKDYVTFAYLYENNYNKVETDSKLQTKANASDVYTKTQVDTSLALKANSADVYNKTEADDKFQTKIQILTQEEYDALVTAGTVDSNATYLIKSDL